MTMIDSRIYNDSWFFSLSNEAKLLFVFLITNKDCNLIGCYEMPLQLILPHFKATEAKIMQLFKELADRVAYIDGWVVVKNYGKYNPMRNPNIDKSKEKQLRELPEKIREGYETLTKGLGKGLVTLAKPFRETESETETEIGKRESTRERKPNEEDMRQIANDYQVPMSFVLSKWEDVETYCRSTGKKYKDYVATLRNWVKKDAIQIRKEADEQRFGKSKIAFIKTDE
jgi:hypothetical protein